MENRPVADILKAIEKQSAYVFFFPDEVRQELLKTATVQAEGQALKTVLDMIFASADLSYTIKDRQVSISAKGKEQKQLPVDYTSGKIIVAGKILNRSGENIPNASIYCKEMNTGTISDDAGAFSISVVPGCFLEVSHIGYAGKKIKVDKSAGKLDIYLSEDEEAIHEIVVIGYGSVRKEDLTGSVVNVRMDDIRDIPVLSIDQALQGRVPGADIMSATGEPGAATTIRIRGTRSIAATNEPLIVIDGVMDGIHNIADLNPSDIASISILKDASSTAIYGIRGSNGVIIITTKRGSTGKPRITFKSDMGFAQLPGKLDLMNASEFAQFRNDYTCFATSDNYASIGENTPQSAYPYPDPLKFGKGTDWMDEITRTAMYQNHVLSVSGGSEESNYFASLSFNNTEGIVKQSGVKRYTGRLNLEHHLFPWLKVGFKYNYAFRDENPNPAGIGGSSYWNNAIFLSPLLDPYADFNELWGDTGGQKYNSPLATLENTSHIHRRIFSGNTGFFEATPLTGLTIRNLFAHYTYQRHTFKYQNSTLPLNMDRGGQANREEYNDLSLSNEMTLTYKRRFRKKHSLDGVLGLVFTNIKSDNLTLQGIGYMSDELMWNNMGAIPDKQNYTASTSNAKKITQSYLARVNYNYLERYYLTVSGRYEGASNFAKYRKWALFPSVAMKWTVSNETFMRNIRWTDEASVRFSAGRTGNAGIGNYQSLDALTATTSGYLFNGSQPIAFYPSRIASPNLTWEKTGMYNMALDVSLLKKRLNFTLEGYLSYTSDLLLSVQTSSQTGYSTHLSNTGKTSNRGVELSIELHNIAKEHFSWITSFSVSHNKQMVEDIGSDDFVSVFNSAGNNPYMMYGYVKGYPLNALWGFKWGGVWKNVDEVYRNSITKAYASPFYPASPGGWPRYYDIDHNGSLNERDLIYLGNADPYLYGGLQNSFRYRNFSFNIFFHYSLGGKIYNISEQYMGSGSAYSNQYRYMVNAWHPVRNPESDLPRAGSSVLLASDRMVYDATFLRLKNISVGYNLNMDKYTNGIVRDVRFVLSGENLYLWKYYNGFDPDVSTNSGNSALRRVDNGAYPKSRTMIFSIQFSY
jgi:TonB-linked SusC/RagA family outer membrane protein